MSKPNKVIVGTFGAPYGIKGWIKVTHYTPGVDLLGFSPWYYQKKGDWHPLRVVEGRPHQDRWVVKIEGVDTPEAAQHYTNASIGVERDQFPELEDDQFYWADLEGLTVVNLEGKVIGDVEYVFATGANDVLVIQKGHQEKELIPFVDAVIQTVSLAEGKIVVDWAVE